MIYHGSFMIHNKSFMIYVWEGGGRGEAAGRAGFPCYFPENTSLREPQRLSTIAVPWHRVWRIKSFYVTPRDQLTWLKVMHRNLYLAGNSSEGDTSCRVCADKENIIHLVRCAKIKAAFWDKIARVMEEMQMEVPQGALGREAFWILGRLDHQRVVGPVQSGIVFIAWRCLYAEVVQARLEDKELNLEHAYARLIRMIISRLKANAER